MLHFCKGKKTREPEKKTLGARSPRTNNIYIPSGSCWPIRADKGWYQYLGWYSSQIWRWAKDSHLGRISGRRALSLRHLCVHKSSTLLTAILKRWKRKPPWATGVKETPPPPLIIAALISSFSGIERLGWFLLPLVYPSQGYLTLPPLPRSPAFCVRTTEWGTVGRSNPKSVHSSYESMFCGVL